jgi:hypothetical protein
MTNVLPPTRIRHGHAFEGDRLSSEIIEDVVRNRRALNDAGARYILVVSPPFTR